MVHAAGFEEVMPWRMAAAFAMSCWSAVGFFQESWLSIPLRVVLVTVLQTLFTIIFFGVAGFGWVLLVDG